MTCCVVGLCSGAQSVRPRRGWFGLSTLFAAAAATVSVGLSNPARGAVIFDHTFSDKSAATANQLSAHVVFDVVGDDLKITATNTGAAAAAPADVITGILFGLSSPRSLHAKSVEFANASRNADGDQLLNSSGAEPIGKHWEFSTFTTPVGAQHYGLGASGLGGTFGHANFQTPGDALQGVDYGLVNGLSDRANTGVHVPLVSRSLTFTVSGLNNGNNNSTPLDVIGVRVQYGSNLTEPALAFGNAIVPEPATMSTVGAAGLTLLGTRRRRRD